MTPLTQLRDAETTDDERNYFDTDSEATFGRKSETRNKINKIENKNFKELQLAGNTDSSNLKYYLCDYHRQNILQICVPK